MWTLFFIKFNFFMKNEIKNIYFLQVGTEVTNFIGMISYAFGFQED